MKPLQREGFPGDGFLITFVSMKRKEKPFQYLRPISPPVFCKVQRGRSCYFPNQKKIQKASAQNIK